MNIGAIAGRDMGALFDPVRSDRMDDWHRAAGAKWPCRPMDARHLPARERDDARG